MKVTHVSICATPEAQAQGRPGLTPELMAAVGGRYSRNGQGLDEILKLVDWDNPGESADRILKFCDYGHMSLMDMAEVSVFMDDLSIYLIAWIWSQVPTGAGQETSTRYCRFDPSGLLSFELTGIPEELRDDWLQSMVDTFQCYHRALEIWSEIFDRVPALARIPPSLIEAAEGGDEKARKQVDRMRRNYAFDRARSWIPVAARTNIMLTMSARGWIELVQKLLGLPCPEASALAGQLQSELELAVPRLTRHAVEKEYWKQGFQYEFELLRLKADTHFLPASLREDTDFAFIAAPTEVKLEVSIPHTWMWGHRFVEDLQFHPNRYAYVGPHLRRTQVRAMASAVDFACIRDMRRHRTGYNHVELIPQGFYWAADQLTPEVGEFQPELIELARVGQRITRRAYELLAAGDPSYLYWTLLGTQYPFEHGTCMDKAIYEWELRTGVGVHFAYANIYRKWLQEWYRVYPDTRSLILEGSAEPE